MFTWTKSMTLLGTLAVATGLCLAQEKTAQKPVVKETAIQQTSPISGKEMFTEYCAPCHGTDGKGTGPAAAAMKAPPTDLTQLAKKGGKTRAERYDKATLSKWAKKGGRPRKDKGQSK